MQLDGRVAVVTGGGAETGRAIALRLAASGALVVVADIDLAAAEATVTAIEKQSGHAAAIAADVTDDGDVRRMIDFAGRDGGGPHVLVNNAGGWGEANYLEATPEQWSATLDLNRHLFINVDLTVHLHRHPVGDWICLDAITIPQPNGVGLADAVLRDQRGPIGRALQTLLVRER